MMTDITVARETQLFLYSLLVGAGLSLLYDLLRVLRLQMRHRPLAVTLEDVAYFLVCAMVTLGFVLKDNRTGARIYSGGGTHRMGGVASVAGQRYGACCQRDCIDAPPAVQDCAVPAVLYL